VDIRDNGRVSLQESLSSELRDVVGPFLRTQGFKGSGRTWRLWLDNGDCAVVNVQSSQFSSATELKFVVNLGYVVPALLEWREVNRGRPIPNSKSIKDSDGIWQARLHAARGGWWSIHSPAEAHSAAEEVVELLSTKGIPTLRSLRNRKTLLEALTTHKTEGYGYVGFSIWDVPIVLTDQGMSSELDALLNDFREEGNPDRTAQFIHWARARAERVDSARLNE
jgi:hypothetical protein